MISAESVEFFPVVYGELLDRLDGVPVQLVLPADQVLRRPVAVRARLTVGTPYRATSSRIALAWLADVLSASMRTARRCCRTPRPA
jgi:hypothetical protein